MWRSYRKWNMWIHFVSGDSSIVLRGLKHVHHCFKTHLQAGGIGMQNPDRTESNRAEPGRQVWWKNGVVIQCISHSVQPFTLLTEDGSPHLRARPPSFHQTGVCCDSGSVYLISGPRETRSQWSELYFVLCTLKRWHSLNSNNLPELLKHFSPQGEWHFSTKTPIYLF